MVAKPEENRSGDTHERFLVRLREISQSLDILKQVCEKVPKGRFQSVKIDSSFALKAGEAQASVESSRGVLVCKLKSDGGTQPKSVVFQTPSQAAFAAIPELLKGSGVQDLGLILASLDLSLAEIDR
jgi:NADH:ubiquinone oxidoreductase subunit D